jgi:hypothetical protein
MSTYAVAGRESLQLRPAFGRIARAVGRLLLGKPNVDGYTTQYGLNLRESLRRVTTGVAESTPGRVLAAPHDSWAQPQMTGPDLDHAVLGSNAGWPGTTEGSPHPTSAPLPETFDDVIAEATRHANPTVLGE